MIEATYFGLLIWYSKTENIYIFAEPANGKTTEQGQELDIYQKTSLIPSLILFDASVRV